MKLCSKLRPPLSRSGETVSGSCLPHPQSYDTGLYHAQAIQWNETYPTVVGLGNLHDRLAFNSHFFLLSAFFSFSFLELPPLHLVNGFLTLLFSLACAIEVAESKAFSFRFVFHAFLLLFNFLVHYRWVSSPTPDVHVALLLWYLFALLTFGLDPRDPNRSFNVNLVFQLALLASTIKLSAAPALLVAPLMAYKLNYCHRLKRYAALAAIAVAIFVPWLVRNVVLSGWLVYPLPWLDLFQFDWEIPSSRARELVEAIRAYGRLPSGAPEVARASGATMKLGEWSPVWLTARPTDMGEKLLLLLAVVAAPVVSLRVAWGNFKAPEARPAVYGWAICLLGLVFWFVSAPDLRFVNGFLAPCALLTFGLLFGDRFAARLGRLKVGSLKRLVAVPLVGYLAALLFLAATLWTPNILVSVARRLMPISARHQWLLPEV